MSGIVTAARPSAREAGLFGIDLIFGWAGCRRGWPTYDAIVTSKDLKSDQAEKLMAVVGRQLDFLSRLQKRMQTCRFPHNDPLVIAAFKAHDGVQHLYMAAHYASCKSGVGQPR